MIPLFLVITTFASLFAMAGGCVGLALELNPSRLNKIVCGVSTTVFIASVIIIMAQY